MKEQGVKQYLYSIRDEQKEIKILNDRLEELESSLMPQAIQYDTERVTTSPTADALPMAIERINECAAKLKEKIRELNDRRYNAVRIIGQLSDSRERATLTSFFLSTDRKTMYQVSVDLGYSERETYRFYQKGLENLKMLSVYGSK